MDRHRTHTETESYEMEPQVGQWVDRCPERNAETAGWRSSVWALKEQGVGKIAGSHGMSQQLVLAVVGSVSATCLTILAALLTLACIRKSCLHRRRTFTYQSGSVSHLYPPPGICVQTLRIYVSLYTHKYLFTVSVYVCTHGCLGVRLYSKAYKGTMCNFIHFYRIECSS